MYEVAVVVVVFLELHTFKVPEGVRFEKLHAAMRARIRFLRARRAKYFVVNSAATERMRGHREAYH